LVSIEPPRHRRLPRPQDRPRLPRLQL